MTDWLQSTDLASGGRECSLHHRCSLKAARLFHASWTVDRSRVWSWSRQNEYTTAQSARCMSRNNARRKRIARTDRCSCHARGGAAGSKPPASPVRCAASAFPSSVEVGAARRRSMIYCPRPNSLLSGRSSEDSAHRRRDKPGRQRPFPAPTDVCS